MQPPFLEQPSEIFQRLRAGTWDVHQQIESRVRVFDPDFDLAGYVQLLQRFYGFWAPLETELAQVNGLNDPALSLPTRLKRHLLEADLHYFSCDPARLSRCHRLPSVETFWTGLGCLYVLEGSTLGSRFISKRIGSHLQLHDGSGASFFNAYGKTVGQRWLEFKCFVTAQDTNQHSDQIVTTARETFECFYDWLGETAMPGKPV